MIGRNHEECEGDRGAVDGTRLFDRHGASIRGMQFLDTGQFLQHQERFVGTIPSCSDRDPSDKFRARFPVPAATGKIGLL